MSAGHVGKRKKGSVMMGACMPLGEFRGGKILSAVEGHTLRAAEFVSFCSFYLPQ